MTRIAPIASWSIAAALLLATLAPATARAAVTKQQVEAAIKNGTRFLIRAQREDGSWPDADTRAETGTTSLVALALLTAGESPKSPPIARALEFLRKKSAEDMGRTYSVALQTMVFAAADPDRFKLQIAANVSWLEKAQFKAGDHLPWPGSWTYDMDKGNSGDNSNTQYALLGLYAASEVGIPVKREVWALGRQYWEMAQWRDGSFGYMPPEAKSQPPSASMTCAGISSLVITGLRRYEGLESLDEAGNARNCGKHALNPVLEKATKWLGDHFRVGENYGQFEGSRWRYYYLYGLERAGRLTGQRYFGTDPVTGRPWDWYREGAELLVRQQTPLDGSWPGGQITERDPLISTSFALLFLAKGRSPVLINKLRHGPGDDWDNDRDDARNLAAAVSKDWNHLLTWQVVDAERSSVEELLQAPILYMNGHEAPAFTAEAKSKLKMFVEQGGFVFAEACCGRDEFDKGFRNLVEELFPDPEDALHPLGEDHAVWRSKYELKPDVHPLWGIEHGCRTVLIYSPGDLSCGWNQAEVQPTNLAVEKARRVGQNIVDYVTGREMPADKLDVRNINVAKVEGAKRGALHIGKLRHAGEWNIAPQSIPNLTSFLRDAPIKFDVVVNHREISPRDPNLVNYPLLYLHGRTALTFSAEELAALRKHLDPGGGTLFADAACGSPAFDVSFRKLAAELLPDHPLEPIPRDDDLYTVKGGGFDLSQTEYTKAAGGGRDLPQLEGIKLDGHWAVIYSKYDIGCALERPQGLDCKGYAHNSALKIASNIVIYSTLP